MDQKEFDRQGNDMGFPTSTRDITDKKLLEIRVAEVHKRYLEILDLQDDLVALSHPDSTLTYVNFAYAKFHGKRPEELVGSRWYAFLSEEDIEQHRKIIESLTIHNRSSKVVNVSNDLAGNPHWYEWVVKGIFDEDGQLKELYTSGHEITELKLLNEKLRISQTRLKEVLDYQSDMIVRHTIDSTILFVNKAFAWFSGTPRERFIGLKWFDLVSAEVASQVRQLMEMLTPESPSSKYEMMNKRYDGKELWISWISTGIFDEAGKLVELQVVGRDVSDRKEAEKKLNTAHEELSELKRKLEQENLYLREKTTVSKPMGGIVADSACMYEVFEKVKQVASTNAPVLLIGETGTGKELVAHAIHNASRRNKRTMVTVNCAALPPSLIESELFGREKGAYTGALSKQIGRFELANNSTLFLDEIGELPVEIQVKLLRVLQFGEYQLLGSPETRKVDVRIIAASNKNLSKAVADGSFRSDLFYRLNVFPIVIPPLRERKEDIPSLVFHFVDDIGQNMGKRIEKVSTRSMNKLLRHDWPGNVRELRNIIEYNMILSSDHTLEINLPDSSADSPAAGSLHDQGKMIIERVLLQTGWRIRGKDGAAEKLGMKESTLRFKMKKLGLTRP